MNRFLTILAVCALALSGRAQQVPVASEFAVLRTDRVVVHTGESEHLSCSITGMGDTAQISCDSSTGSGVPLVYHIALVVGSNHVGYVVSCGGGLVWRIHCSALSAGQVLKGFVDGGKLTVSLDSKTRTYRVETSQYIGPLGGKSSPQGSVDPLRPPAPVEGPNAGPSVKRTVQTQRPGDPNPPPTTQADGRDPASNGAKVMVSSEPSGADIYVDERFVGNTPSLIQLEAGSHAVRVESKGRRTWTRAISLTAGSKISLQATLDAER